MEREITYTTTRVFLVDLVRICGVTFSKCPDKDIRRDYFEFLKRTRELSKQTLNDMLTGKVVWCNKTEDTIDIGSIYMAFLGYAYIRLPLLVNIFQEYDEVISDQVINGTKSEQTYKIGVENFHSFLKALEKAKGMVLLSTSAMYTLDLGFDDETFTIKAIVDDRFDELLKRDLLDVLLEME